MDDILGLAGEWIAGIRVVSRNDKVRKAARVLEVAVSVIQNMKSSGMDDAEIIDRLERIRPHNKRSIDTYIDKIAEKLPHSEPPRNTDDEDTKP